MKVSFEVNPSWLAYGCYMVKQTKLCELGKLVRIVPVAWIITEAASRHNQRISHG